MMLQAAPLVVDLLLTPADETTETELAEFRGLPVVFRTQRIALPSERIDTETLLPARRRIAEALAVFQPPGRALCTGLACTSLSLCVGEQVEWISMFESLVRAMRYCAPQAKRVALFTPYVAELHELTRVALKQRNFTVVWQRYLDLGTDSQIARVSPEIVLQAARDVSRQECDLMVIACSGLKLCSGHDGRLLDELEAAAGLPVVASLPAHLWDLLSRCGLTTQLRGKGFLFSGQDSS